MAQFHAVTSLVMLLLLGFVLGVASMTCRDLKDFYKEESCCGNPNKPVGAVFPSSSLCTRQMVIDAQKAWGDGIVAIAAAKTNGEDYEQVAHDHITNLYAYGIGDVLFKPTLAAEMQFRSSFEGALSYFVATNGEAGEDTGFAIKGWTKVQFYNDEIITSGNTAVAMGNYLFTTPEGEEVKVEYSFGYVLDSEGTLRINLHHSSLPYAPSISCSDSTVTEQMVLDAQQEWGDGIVAIAAAKVNGEDFEQVAHDHITNLYAYGSGDVLFKPTLAAERQFRSSFDGALSYFVATNSHSPEDSGFAIKGWTKVEFQNEEIITSGKTAMAMGNYFFTTPEDTIVKVEYSFGYVLDELGKLRINMHHSSMPYSVVSCGNGTVTKQMVEAAQQAWGDGILTIAAAKIAGEDYEAAAREHIETLYAYGLAPVLFKPTLAAQAQFRSDFDGALSYFVATNNEHPEDSGFAIKGWTAVRFVNEEVIVSGRNAMAMGNYYFTNPDGNEVKVEYSFGYILDEAGALRIYLHHSSLPYEVSVVACDTNLTKQVVLDAQQAWGNGIVAISHAHESGGDFEQVARDLVTNLYAYNESDVLFKPTLAQDAQFRETFDGALSYFVAENNEHPEDNGFAIKNWTAVRFENDEIILAGNTAVAMGNYFFTSGTTGDETKVEFSFGYLLDVNDNLRINLHHSSLPYTP